MYERDPGVITVDESGIGVVECDGGGIGRVGHSSWLRGGRRWGGVYRTEVRRTKRGSLPCNRRWLC